MIITIGGPPGSGKTTVGQLLAKKLGMEFVSTGMVFRAMAHERGATLEDFGKLAMENHDIDRELDKRVLGMAREKDKLVLEGRLAAHMLHHNGIPCFKVWVEAHIHTRAQRISGRESKDQEQVRQEIRNREECERARYRTIYDIDLDSLGIYDHVVNSDDMTPEQILDDITDAWRVRKNAGA